MAVEIKLNQNVVWGTSTAGTLASQGKILNATKKKGSKLFEQTDENDETSTVIFHDQTVEATLEILAIPTATIPDPGDAITVVGVTDLLVLDAEEVWANNQTKKIRMNVKKWVA